MHRVWCGLLDVHLHAAGVAGSALERNVADVFT